MSKKSRRIRTKFQGFAGKQSQIQTRPQETKEGAVIPVFTKVIPAAAKARNYEYLIPDLRGIGIIALSLFIVLAILTIVIQ
jgi:hypothetical protein